VSGFLPNQDPLSHLKNNYIGALGEIAVKQYLELEIELEDNYKNNEVDFGDLDENGLIYTLKTEAIPENYIFHHSEIISIKELICLILF
jgi:hypothetical protein